jgi:isopentenyldiphosphate isomerase
MTEKLTLVDENDQVIGVGDRKQAWANGYYTRNIRVMLCDQNGRVLSQKRSMQKGTYPGMWTVAASGHVDDGEDWDTAANRETQEEVGLSAHLVLVGNFVFKNDDGDKKIRQIIHVYRGVIDESAEFTLQASEVDEVKWFGLDELKELMRSKPEDFTPSFIETIQRFY